MSLSPNSTQEDKHGIDRIGKILLNPRIRAFGTNFVFLFEPVIRNPDGKELSIFSFFAPAVWKKVQSNAYFPEWKLALIFAILS